ncbi:Ribonuclease HII [uncultured archaeon]|nr:Ribonuclease HII [uncultured archaeon]
MIAGGDEAGRGCVIGPMVICVYGCKEENEKELKKLGVKDSKELSQIQRLRIRKIIEEKGIYEIRIVRVKEINEMMNTFTLNEIEEKAFKEASDKLYKKIKFDKLIYDSPDVKPERFAAKLKMPGVEVIALHKADALHPVVSAASVIAKLTREEEVQKIKDETGIDFGSGYSSDPITIKTLQEQKNNKQFLEFARIHWSTFAKHTGINVKERKVKAHKKSEGLGKWI